MLLDTNHTTVIVVNTRTRNTRILSMGTHVSEVLEARLQLSVLVLVGECALLFSVSALYFSF